MISPQVSTASSIRISQCSASPSRATSSASAMLASTWRVPPDIAEPATGQDTDLFRQAEFFGNHAVLFLSVQVFPERSSLHPLLPVSGGIFSRAQSRGERSVRDDPHPLPFSSAFSVEFAGSVPRTAASILPAMRSSMRACSGMCVLSESPRLSRLFFYQPSPAGSNRPS